jgi:hypothetical protein
MEFRCTRNRRAELEAPSYHVFYEMLRNVDPEQLDRAKLRRAYC